MFAFFFAFFVYQGISHKVYTTVALTVSRCGLGPGSYLNRVAKWGELAPEVFFHHCKFPFERLLLLNDCQFFGF